MKAILIILLIFMLFPSPARGSEWLGEYVGSEIPGYEIVKTMLVLQTDMWTATAEFDNFALLNKFQKTCQLLDGKAIVNLRYAVSIGDVSFRNKQSGLKVTTDGGIHVMVYGDCVLSVKPQKR